MGNLKKDWTQNRKKLIWCVAVPMSSFLYFPACLLLDLGAWDNIFMFIHLYFVSFTYNFQPTNKPDHFKPATGRADHFPPSIPPDQAVFLSANLQSRPFSHAADLQSRPFSTQQTSSPDHFPQSRPPVQTIFHEADLRPDHDQTTCLPAYQAATNLHRTSNF